MKIAVTYDNGEIFQHFGHTEHFKVYDVENGQVKSAAILDSGETGHGALATLLKEGGVDTLICGGIGGGAQAALAQAGIALYAGVTGEADGAVQALLSGTLAYAKDATCHHHDHDHSHCHASSTPAALEPLPEKEPPTGGPDDDWQSIFNILFK